MRWLPCPSFTRIPSARYDPKFMESACDFCGGGRFKDHRHGVDAARGDVPIDSNAGRETARFQRQVATYVAATEVYHAPHTISARNTDHLPFLAVVTAPIGKGC